jgi:hypothetical protein
VLDGVAVGLKGSRWARAQPGATNEIRSARLQIENVRCVANDGTDRRGLQGAER